MFALFYTPNKHFPSKPATGSIIYRFVNAKSTNRHSTANSYQNFTTKPNIFTINTFSPHTHTHSHNFVNKISFGTKYDIIIFSLFLPIYMAACSFHFRIVCSILTQTQTHTQLRTLSVVVTSETRHQRKLNKNGKIGRERKIISVFQRTKNNVCVAASRK